MGNQITITSKDKEQLNLNYLFYIVNDERFWPQRGGGQPFIALGDARKVKIPLPPIEDQIRIAHLLSKVEGLIALRKQDLQQLDHLLKSVFLEMFGDPMRNEKGWEKKPFSKLLADIESGKSPKCEAREATLDEWGVLKLGAVTSCHFNENENKALPPDIEPQTRAEVRQGDLLFSRKNTYELVAACAYVFKTRPKLLMPDLIFRFVFNEHAEIDPIFVWKLLTAASQRKKIQSFAAGAAGSMPNISKTNLKQVLIPIPPLVLQNQFAAIVEKVEGIKSQYQQSLTELENLYGVLSQKAFKRELDLSRVPLTLITNHESHEESKPSEAESAEREAPFAALDQAELTTSQGRVRLLQKWFEEWLNNAKQTETFSVTQFWQNAQLRALDYQGKEDEYPDFSLTEYDQLKQWVFAAIEKGQIQQTRNIVSAPGEEVQYGNQIVLKKVIG